MDIGSIGMANTSGWYSQATAAVRQPEASQTEHTTQQANPQPAAEPVGDLYDWQGTVVDAYA